MKLAEVGVGRYRVIGVMSDKKWRRLMELGFTRGIEIEVKMKVYSNIVIWLRGYRIAMRDTEADKIEVERIV